MGNSAAGRSTVVAGQENEKPGPMPPVPQTLSRQRPRVLVRVQVAIYYPKSLQSWPSVNFTEAGFDSLLYAMQAVRFATNFSGPKLLHSLLLHHVPFASSYSYKLLFVIRGKCLGNQ
jgi:hypothetical protein